MISIIVTSYTMERFNDLAELLDSLQAQTYRDFETIVVLERSMELYDELKAYIMEKGYPNTRVLFNDGPCGISPARNLGIKEARGEIIAFIDDDALPFPEWTQQIVQTYAEDDSVIAVSGPAFPLWEDESMSWLPEEFYWICGCMTREWADKRETRNVRGANMSFRREAFNLSGLFPDWLGSERGSKRGVQNTTAEETELSIRVRSKTGKRIVFNPEMKIWHKVFKFRLSWAYLQKRAFIEGYSKAMIRKFHEAANDGEKVLATEYALLRRILLKLFPNILLGFFTKPFTSWRRLWATATVLCFVALGYLRGTVHSMSGRGHLG